MKATLDKRENDHGNVPKTLFTKTGIAWVWHTYHDFSTSALITNPISLLIVFRTPQILKIMDG
jgi:hypothetical protein